MSLLPKLPTDEQRLVIGYVLGIAAAAATLLCAVVGGSNWPLQLTLALLGGASGWTFGILLSPLDDEETSKFGSMTKAVAAVLSGFVVAKLEPTIVKEVEVALSDDGHLFSFRAVLFLTLFVVCFLFTLISRLYGSDATARKKKQQAQLLSKAEKLLAKYHQLKSEA